MELIVRHLGQKSYESVWHDMQRFTDNRNKNTDDEIWIVQHSPVFTLGKAGKTEHLLNTGDIPVVKVDRGGQVTYHGPGQLVVYVLLDLNRLKLGIRELVTRLENCVINLLSEYGIKAVSKKEAPGVYVDDKKIAALGLRVRRGCCFHGLALNVDMNLDPFSRINPCGYEGLEITQLSDFISDINFDIITHQLLKRLESQIQNTQTLI
jgi:lipoyl(octanoyl) transferase